MLLGLDLTASEAKIARARVHYDALKREFLDALEKVDPYLLRCEMNENTGWFRAIAAFRDESKDFGLSVIVGDIIHNLRSAPDYIVTALVDRSPGAKLNKRHQFPIFDDIDTYRDHVGNANHALSKGQLGGVVYGLKEIWDLQPFHLKNPVDDPLFAINVISNADKHRAIVRGWTSMGATRITLNPPGLSIIDELKGPVTLDYEPNKDYELLCVRIGRPYPPQIEVQANSSAVNVSFGTEPFGKHKDGFSIQAGVLGHFCDHVAMIVNAFKSI